MSETRKNTVKFNLACRNITDLYNTSVNLSKAQLSEFDKQKFYCKLKDLDKHWNLLNDSYSCLASGNSDEEQLQKLEIKHAEICEIFYSIKVLSDSSTTGESSQSKPGAEFHLPKITLPHFSGISKEWPNFISIFNSLIHNNTSLGSVEKMHYLLSILQGEALLLIKHLVISSQNYNIAYEILCDRYENKRLIADKYVESILNLSNLTQLNYKSLSKFINTIKESTQALNALNFDVNSWSFLLLHIISKKLPLDLRTKFESTIASSTTIPEFKSLICFLENQLRIIETVHSSNVKSTSSSFNIVNPSHHNTFKNISCPCCQESHRIYQCPRFEAMKPTERKSFVSNHALCINCLRNHKVTKCFSKSTCQICDGRHHTKLHIALNSSTSSNNVSINSAPQANETAVSTCNSTVQSLHSHSIHSGSTMLLGTALVGVQDVNGHTHRVRALLDCGSQVTVATESLAQKLRIPRSTSDPLTGLGGSSQQHTNGQITCSIKPITDSSLSTLVTQAIILKRITNDLPRVQVSPMVLDKCRGLSLADREFNTPGPIDLLIGVDLYDQVFDGRKLRLGEDLPTAYGSIFGWVLMGKAPMETSVNFTGFTTLSVLSDLDSTLTKFWEVEEVPASTAQDPENVQCEKHFVETHSRDDTGRFIVHLPFKTEHKPLGETHTNALKRFYNLERKLQRDSRLRELYIEFMQDYLKSGHMRLIKCVPSQNRYYIPHHGVLKESSSTTKLRAVFDASAPSSSGVSLNQVLLAGPKLQQNVEDIILRFRTHAVVFTCDVKQMYRQVRVSGSDSRYQTIFWRESTEDPLQQFELTTVTYGVTSSAYLAMRVIRELASLNMEAYPDAARVLSEDIFVDDIISGGSDVASVRALQQQVVDVLAQGGFLLRKWASNSSDVLQDYPKDHHETPLRFEESGDNVFKVLGIEWNAQSDSFIYHASSMGKCSTKREMLSNIARIYDPCGFLAPVTFYAKLIMQRLWSHEFGWDDQLPEDFLSLWKSFVEDINLLRKPKISRFISSTQPERCDLIGFCDASESGFAAVVYLRVLDCSGEVNVHLLLAKSRVAPIKQRLTIPRLELSGAHLLSRLLSHVVDVLGRRLTITDIIAWCDSRIVLAWLRTPPYKLQTFEGNRVSQIQGLIPSAHWRHVPSALNPADCASRGLLPSDLVIHTLWWCPEWLMADPTSWPADCSTAINTDLPGLKSQVLSVHHTHDSTLSSTANTDSIVTRFSSLSRLQRIVAWILRFANNARKLNTIIKGPLNSHELIKSLHKVVNLVQLEMFGAHISAIAKGSLTGPLASLNPFLDDEGILRVGGRLTNSTLPFASKHPILLPKSHHLTNLIVDYYHQVNLHAGPSILINILRQSFWILSARNVVRQRVHRCHRCHRLKAKMLEPFMGNLPSARVRQARPFLKVGIDFAGPFNVKISNYRNAKIGKSYLCLYICFAVKAVHLEVTSDLTTDAFMASFRRFVSRRGKVSEVFTDQGKNFQGAKRYLSEVETFLTQNKDSISEALTDAHVKWQMNPPYAPHMGGLWESSVKSAKQLLKRTIGEQVLTFEELTTVFAQVEAVLNSRPLCPISNSPDDIDVLTPGHFLIGQPLVSLPDFDFDHLPSSRLSRWQLVQQVSQHFWRRWQVEYLHNLQQRAKWNKFSNNIQLGDLVLIKEDNTPPLQWRKGRVVKLHPGSDSIVRVVELKTANGICTRSVTKLSPLPYQN